MKTLVEKQKTGLIKKFHTLCGQISLSEEDRRYMLISNYGVCSSLDLEYKDLVELCSRLELDANPQLKKLDEARKRLIASIGAWLRAMNLPENMHSIKGVACRASKRESFNDIPLEQLRSLYSAFNKKRKDLEMVEFMTSEQIELLSLQN